MGTSEKKNRKIEDRVIRTPNLLIWNQTRYRCAMPSCLFASQLTTWQTDIDQFRWMENDIRYENEQVEWYKSSRSIDGK